MKKGVTKLLSTTFVLLIVLLSISVVFAAAVDPNAAGKGVRSVGEWVNEFLQGLLFGSTEPSNPMAAVTHIFMGLILFVLIYSVFDMMNLFPDKASSTKTTFNVLITVGVTMLTLIALPSDFFSYILPSYGAMGAAMLTILPFLIIFMFSIRVRSVFFAQMTWVLFAVYFLGFYFLRGFSTIGNATTGTETAGGILYLIIGIVGVVMIFFVPLVRGWFRGSGVQEAVKDINRSGHVTRALMRARKEEAEALADLGKAGTD